MEIKLSRLKQIISEVVEERHASDRMDNIIQSTREEEVVEEIDPHDQLLDDMIAEEIEAAIEEGVLISLMVAKPQGMALMMATRVMRWHRRSRSSNLQLV